MDAPSPKSPATLEDVAAAVGASLLELRALAEALDGNAREDAERLTAQLETAATTVQGALNDLASEVDEEAAEEDAAPKESAQARKGKGKPKKVAEPSPDTDPDDPWTTVQLGAKHEEYEGAALQGHTASIAIPEVLGFLASLRKSGTLQVESPQEVFQIELREGSVVYAHGANPPKGMRLGQILVQQGAVTQEDLDAFFERSKGSMVGKGLLEEGIVDEDALRIALAFQAQHVFHRLYASSNATFEFLEDVHVEKREDIQLNVTRLLLESARSMDEREAQVDEALSWLDG